MIKVSKKLSIIISLVVIVTAGSFAIRGAQNNKKNDVKIVKMDGDVDTFDSISQLKQKASAIVEVNVLNSQTIVYNDMPFTISNAKVLSTTKGKINSGEEIKLIETGGKYKLSGTNPKETKGQEVELAFDGVRVMQPGEHLFLFVQEFNGPQVKDAYIPLGVYQGKFKINDNGNVEQQAAPEHKLKDYKPIKAKEFMEKLN